MEFRYLEQDGSDKHEESNWYHFCGRNKIPYIITRKRTAFGDVEWDYITLPPDEEKFLESEESFIKKELNELLAYYETADTYSNIQSLTGYAKNLQAQCVSDFARDVTNTLIEAKRRHAAKCA